MTTQQQPQNNHTIHHNISTLSPGDALRETLNSRPITSVVGVYDLFSTTIVARHFAGIFMSGFGFAASYYGLPDIGFIAWPDIVAWVERTRILFPTHHIVVDIDDGYCDVEVACHVVALLEKAGASGVVLEDQKRPRKCGHFEGKQILDLDEFVIKLKRVLQTRKNMVVIARTDSSDYEDIRKRAQAFKDAGADLILVDGLKDLQLLHDLKEEIPAHYMFNQIAGGKSPPADWDQLVKAGVKLVNYSTPCLFAAQKAIDDAMLEIKRKNGKIEGGISVKDCSALLFENLERRDKH